jgi:hypothetical protein
MQLEFNIFCVRPAYVRIQMDSIRHFRHESFRKPHCPAAVVIFEHRPERKSPRVRRVVVCPVVVDRPIHKLDCRVAAVGVQIEKISHAELAESQLQPACRQRAEQRIRCSRSGRPFAAEWDNLMPHQARDVWRFTQQWIAHHIQIRGAREPQGLPDPMPSGLLHIEEQFRRGRQPQTSE